MALLEIENLHAEIEGSPILKGVNLSVEAGEVHAIMGPNGSGKSTLSYILAGREDYEITGGTIRFNGQDLLEMGPDERAVAGLFLAFQYPVELPGVTPTTFLKAAVNSKRKARGEGEIDNMEFMKLMREKARQMDIDEQLLKRPVNVGFSGGEKKRNEVFQMAVLDPLLCVLDETDSGLDIDALRTVADGVNRLRDAQRAMVVVTHYQRLLNYIVPDKVHVMKDGRIIQSGDKHLAEKLEAEGYQGLVESAA